MFARAGIRRAQGEAPPREARGRLHRRTRASLPGRKEVIRDIDLVATSGDPAALAEAFRRQLGVADVIGSGETKTSVRFADGLAADLRIVSEDEFGAALQYFTGSEDHNTQLRG